MKAEPQATAPPMDLFDQMESEVRSYCRTFPVVFDRASGPHLYDVDGRSYIDFFCGAGALNYGHNPPEMKRELIAYLERDGIAHSLDMATTAKRAFMERFRDLILEPRHLEYKFQFTGPTGANAVEAALKLARKATGRTNVIAFTRAYHGLSMGALAATASTEYRNPRFLNRADVTFMPYDGFLGPDADALDYLRRFIADPNSGVDPAAAILVETIQADGGVRVASSRWLKGLETICREAGMLLIVDDIQVGCGRTGSFFSFEDSAIRPDIVVLSKSISGYGLPMSLLLLRPEIDVWDPGEHTGTFRGNNCAFVTAAEALRNWNDAGFLAGVQRNAEALDAGLERIRAKHPALEIETRGRGMIRGLETPSGAVNRRIADECFRNGLILEVCGGERNVVKVMPPLNIPADVLESGLEALDASVSASAPS